MYWVDLLKNSQITPDVCQTYSTEHIPQEYFQILHQQLILIAYMIYCQIHIFYNSL